MSPGTTPEVGSDGWWLLRDGEVLAAAEVAKSIGQRTKGLLGQNGYEGAMVLPTRAPCTRSGCALPSMSHS